MKTDWFLVVMRLVLFACGASIFYWVGTAPLPELIEATARAFPVYMACQFWNAAVASPKHRA